MKDATARSGMAARVGYHRSWSRKNLIRKTGAAQAANGTLNLQPKKMKHAAPIVSHTQELAERQTFAAFMKQPPPYVWYTRFDAGASKNTSIGSVISLDFPS
jgi:hypothetical protein